MTRRCYAAELLRSVKRAPRCMRQSMLMPCLGFGAQGTAVTSGLRKVTDDMKTKNRADRSGHVTAMPAAAAPKPAVKPAAASRGPPRYTML